MSRPVYMLQTVLNSMHKYIPRFRLVRADDLRKLHYINSTDFFFVETSFIAVTAYQNPDVSFYGILNIHGIAKTSNNLKGELTVYDIRTL